MIRRLIDSYVTEGKVRMDIVTWLDNPEADQGLESIQNTTIFMTSAEARKLITRLKSALFDLDEQENA